MKKIPTLFKREFKNHKVVNITPEVTDGMEWVLKGEGVATEKIDGACCAIFDGILYKRYDAKNGKPIPEGAIKCQEEPDPVTGHMPCWVKCDRNNPSDKWFWEAYDRHRFMWSMLANNKIMYDHTFEAIGPHFNGNPYNLKYDILVPHGCGVMKDVPRTFEGIKEFLKNYDIEGIVFWKDGEPKCKIKRSDFGFKWR